MAKKLFRNAHQLRQLKRLDPASHNAALTAAANGLYALATEIVRKGMLAAFDRLLAARRPTQPVIAPVLYDLLIASRSFGAGDMGDVHARITWLKETGCPKQVPPGLVTLADLLPKLEGYTLVATQKTPAEIIRKYRKAEVQR